MRALSFPNFGTAPSITDIDLPGPAAGEILVKVAAASVIKTLQMDLCAFRL